MIDSRIVDKLKIGIVAFIANMLFLGFAAIKNLATAAEFTRLAIIIILAYAVIGFFHKKWNLNPKIVMLSCMLVTIGNVLQCSLYQDKQSYPDLLRFTSIPPVQSRFIILVMTFVFGFIGYAVNKLSFKYIKNRSMIVLSGGLTMLIYLLMLISPFYDETRLIIIGLKVAGHCVQTHEFTKILSVLFHVSVFHEKTLNEKQKWLIIVGYMIISGAFYFKASELGTFLVLVMVHFFLVYVRIPSDTSEGRKLWNEYLLVLLVLMITGVFALLFLEPLMEKSGVEILVLKKVYDRLRGVMNPENLSGENNFQAYSAWQADLAGKLFGSTGVIYVPVMEGDFAFTYLIMRFGIIVAVIVFFLHYGMFQMTLHGEYQGSSKERLMCYGFAATIFLQALYNMGMCLSVYPICGIGLPLISYGGMNICVTVMMLTMIASNVIEEE